MRAVVLLLLGMAASAWAATDLSAPAPDGLRPGGTLGETLPAPVIAAPERDGPRAARSHPFLPPVVPHHVRDHQVDLNANRCLACHDTGNAERMQAPAMSSTHYRDRSGATREQVAGARYFCLSCHVPQHRVAPAVDNTFGRPEGHHAPLDR